MVAPSLIFMSLLADLDAGAQATSTSADACCLCVFFAMASTVNVETAELCQLQSRQTIRYINDKPNVRRARLCSGCARFNCRVREPSPVSLLKDGASQSYV